MYLLPTTPEYSECILSLKIHYFSECIIKFFAGLEMSIV